MTFLLTLDRPAVIEFLEDYMNGNNIYVVVGIVNAFLVSRARQKVLVLWKRSASHLSTNAQIYCSLKYTPDMKDMDHLSWKGLRMDVFTPFYLA